jgi:hypothetical protein
MLIEQSVCRDRLLGVLGASREAQRREQAKMTSRKAEVGHICLCAEANLEFALCAVNVDL